MIIFIIQIILLILIIIALPILGAHARMLEKGTILVEQIPGARGRWRHTPDPRGDVDIEPPEATRYSYLSNRLTEYLAAQTYGL